MRTLTIATALTASLAAVGPHRAHAQEVNLASLEEDTNRLHVTAGAEYSFIAGLGYSRVVPVLDRTIVLGGEARIPWADIDAGDWSVRGSALVPVVGTRHWKLAASVAPVLRGTANNISRMIDAGIDTALIGGFYHRHVFVAGELGFDAALTTHVSHTADYRMTVHPDAKDGWYASPGGNVRAGVQAGASFGRYDVIARAGQVRDIDGAPPIFPFYATLTVNARW